MNLGEVDGGMAVDQHIHGFARVRTVELRDMTQWAPVLGRPGRAPYAVTPESGLVLSCSVANVPAGFFHRAQQYRVADTRCMELRRQHGEIEGIAPCAALQSATWGERRRRGALSRMLDP
jgi:hypothetical protein